MLDPLAPGHTRNMNLMVSSVLRTIAVVVLSRAVIVILERGEGASANADIGGGAIAIAAVWVLVCVWGWFDGRRVARNEAMARWVGSAVLFGLVILVRSWVREGWDPTLLIVAPLIAAVGVLPALLAVVVGGSGRASADSQHTRG